MPLCSACFAVWHSSTDTVIPAKGKAIVPTDISIALPDGCYGARPRPTLQHGAPCRCSRGLTLSFECSLACSSVAQAAWRPGPGWR